MPKDTNQQPSYAELKDANAATAGQVQVLESQVENLKRQVAWFQKQMFGSKSERRLADENPDQLLLDGLLGEAPKTAPVPLETITYQRGKASKKRGSDCVTDSGLRFDETVPVEVIEVASPELSGPDADQYEVIGNKSVHRLAQRPASYVVLRYDHKVIKRKDSKAVINTLVPGGVFDQSLADVSFLAGMLVDKFMYHLPLYRQHQRLQQAGIALSRATLTNLTRRSIELLRPIVEAQLRNILRSKVLAMDETPVKSRRSGKGKMKTGWFWPVCGDQGEIVFTYANSRAKAHIEQVLAEGFKGTLISDGYVAYACYTEAQEGVIHAQCWVHGRRHFITAEDVEPALVATALQHIRELYAIEAVIKQKQLTGDKKRNWRMKYSAPVVNAFFAWCENQLNNKELLPDNPLLKAVRYMLHRQAKLKVFLEDPDVPMDTNYIERALRPIPMGRKNWNFCWTELGAEHVGIIQSLISTCKIQDIDPYVYLVDVLQRINLHPASNVEALTPRLWKEKFAQAPMRSAIYHGGDELGK
ncbi:MAG: IS66 family transposase [Pseudomonadales bacterium]|nr:IS66 family transposase [Pseudomonadales bacterium]